MKPIIASTDFSPVSLNAVNYAADLACALNTDLYLIHIFQLPIVYSEIPVAADGIDNQVKEAEERIKELKDSIAKRCGEKIEIYTEVKVDTVIAGIKEL